MELYRIIATIVNTSTTFQLAYLPENFEGVKISQSFSFVNPIGYNPKFSVDTMRIILSDKAAIDTVFNTYGLQSDVTLLIKKLNTSGIGYSNLATFAIDFESYVVEDVFSEFALKSVSVIDKYNEVKNTEMQFTLTENITIPSTQVLINYVSLKSIGATRLPTNNAYALSFIENNESLFYDKDSALLQTIFAGDGIVESSKILTLGQAGNVNINITYSGKVFMAVDFGTSTTFEVAVYRGGDFSNKVLTLLSGVAMFSGVTDNREFTIPSATSTISGNFASGTNFFVAVKFGIISQISYINIDLFVDTKKPTANKIIENDTLIKATNANTLLTNIFGAGAFSKLANIKITSANSLLSIDDKIIFKPSQFIKDLCTANGLIVNFAVNGSVFFNTFQSYFNNVLYDSNAINISEYKDLSIKINTELNFSSVSVGQENSEYRAYTYLIDWHKILTFAQSKVGSFENLDLSMSRFRSDFSGILDYLFRKSAQKDKGSKDIFIFKDFSARANTVPVLNLYDVFTPRDILQNWSKFLSFCFQNFGQNTLTISSNGGTTDNLNIQGVLQMDNLTLNETPRLLPIQYDFTCLLDSVDFSEKILKINDKGTDIYLFVIKAETTDNLSEQKISGLKIQF